MASRNILTNTEVSMKYGRQDRTATNLAYPQRSPRQNRNAPVRPGRIAAPEVQPPVKRSTPKKTAQVYVPAPVTGGLTASQIRLAVISIAIASVLLLGMIFFAAYAASVQHNINEKKNDIARMEEDIASIKVDIEKASSVAVVEKRAREELGMIYPTQDKYIYLDELAEPEYDVAQMIRDTNYGTPQ